MCRGINTCKYIRSSQVPIFVVFYFLVVVRILVKYYTKKKYYYYTQVRFVNLEEEIKSRS